MSVIIQTENLHHRYPDEEEDSLAANVVNLGDVVPISGDEGIAPTP